MVSLISPVPIGNGWSTHNDELPTVYCNRCRDTFPIDADWIDRHYTNAEDDAENDRDEERLVGHAADRNEWRPRRTKLMTER